MIALLEELHVRQRRFKVFALHIGCSELEECDGIGDGDSDSDGDNDGERAPTKERKNCSMCIRHYLKFFNHI